MPADERREIEAAMDRLLNGTPLRSDGKLTIMSLAAEAGVKRHVLTHKHTDLKDLFNARVKSAALCARQRDRAARAERGTAPQARRHARRTRRVQAGRRRARPRPQRPDHGERRTTPPGQPGARIHRATTARPVTAPAGCWPNPDSDWLDISGGVERPSTFTFRYQAKPDVTSMTRSLQDHPNAVAGRRCRNTAEPSGELSAGDVVAVGEVRLAVGRVGWSLGPRRPERGPHQRARHPPAAVALPPQGAGHMSTLMVTVAGGPRQYKTRTRGDAHLLPGRSVLRLLAVQNRFPRPVRKQEPQADGDLPDAGAGPAAPSACQRLRAVPAPERRGLVGLAWP